MKLRTLIISILLISILLISVLLISVILTACAPKQDVGVTAEDNGRPNCDEIYKTAFEDCTHEYEPGQCRDFLKTIKRDCEKYQNPG